MEHVSQDLVTLVLERCPTEKLAQCAMSLTQPLKASGCRGGDQIAIQRRKG